MQAFFCWRPEVKVCATAGQTTKKYYLDPGGVVNDRCSTMIWNGASLDVFVDRIGGLMKNGIGFKES